MARMTRSSVKEEPIEDSVMQQHPSIATPQRRFSRAATIDSISTPARQQPMGSSGSTVRDEDVGMAHSGGQDDINGTSDGTTASSSTFGRRSQQLIKAIQKIETLNIDATLPSLPKFVVVGDQSHGKSSIIEAICGISLPRSEGTCTRCPFQITTSGCVADANWSCKISLLRRFSYSPKVVSGGKYPKWNDEGTQETVDFAKVSDSTTLEHVLRLAQVAILNPHLQPADVLRANNPDMATSVSFSPNAIALEVSGTDLPELSLIDLPGAINVHEDANEQYLVKFIEQLCRNYLKDEKALVLLAVSANVDVDTSTAFRFVSQCKALGRCMGVLTKPDLMLKGRRHQIGRILNDEIFRLGNGWFATKQLSQEELEEHISHRGARDREAAFFTTEDPWNNLLVDFSHRFGVPNLQDALSKKLTEHIVNALPEISARVEERLQQVTSQLMTFPEQVKAPYLTVVTEVEALRTALVQQLIGDGLSNEFRLSYRKIIQSLRQQLKSAKPRLALSTPGYKEPAIIVDSDDDETPTPTPSKSRRGNDGHAVTTPLRGQAEPRSTPRSTVKRENGTPTLPLRTTFKLDEVKHVYDAGSTSGLPDQLNPKVTDHLIIQSLRGWQDMIDAALREVQDLMSDALGEIIHEKLANRRQTQLFTETIRIVKDLLLELLDSQIQGVHHMVACEMHKPITYANDTLKSIAAVASKELHAKRLETRIDEHYNTLEANGGKVVKSEDRKKKAGDSAWVHSVLGPDTYGRELTAMATPLAYYDIASARMIDNIATHLEYGLFHAIETELRGRLFDGLRTQDSDHCAQLLAEDPRREEQRRRLTAEKEKLLQALDELRGLPQQV